MTTKAAGEQPWRARKPSESGAEGQLRSAWRAWQPRHPYVSADFARTIAVMEMVARVEKDVAKSLQSMAAQDGSEAAARRLRLAEEAIRGADVAAKRSKHLQQLARRSADHADVVTLHLALAHAGAVLADLASTEEAIATTLTRLASKDGSDIAARRRHLADEALAAARCARERARALQELARASATRVRSPAGGPGQQKPEPEPEMTARRYWRRDPDERDHEADDRDKAADARDVAAGARNHNSVVRDATAQARDEVAVIRDLAMRERLLAADQQYHAARAHEAADPTREAAPSGSAVPARPARSWTDVAARRQGAPDQGEAAQGAPDQDEADQDEAAAADRDAAAIVLEKVRQDRRAAAADRLAAVLDREAAAKDRAAAARDRQAAAADRQQAEIERAQERIPGTLD